MNHSLSVVLFARVSAAASSDTDGIGWSSRTRPLKAKPAPVSALEEGVSCVRSIPTSSTVERLRSSPPPTATCWRRSTSP